MNSFGIEKQQLTRNQEEIADALISLGLSRNAANALAYLQEKKEATSTDLEAATMMRQPEVSIVMGVLNGRGWISEREKKKPGKGRPCKVYSLQIEFKDIIAQIEEQQKKAATRAQKRIGRLRELK